MRRVRAPSARADDAKLRRWMQSRMSGERGKVPVVEKECATRGGAGTGKEEISGRGRSDGASGGTLARAQRREASRRA